MKGGRVIVLLFPIRGTDSLRNPVAKFVFLSEITFPLKSSGVT